jgi:hypothetical protein
MKTTTSHPILADLVAGTSPTPERRLMLAVLDDAIRVLETQPYGSRARRLRAETDRWLAADEREWPYSYVNVCDGLGIDPARLRTRVDAACALRSAA